jgi:hypothetical protein
LTNETDRFRIDNDSKLHIGGENMKKMIAKLIAFILVFAVAIPMTTTLANPTVAGAASVALTATKKTIILGNTYTVALKNSSAVAKIFSS